MHSRSFAAALVVAVGLVSASSAAAEGSGTIAGAPVVPYGQQQFGNTSAGTLSNDGDCGWEFWSLPVQSGDAATIDFQISAGYGSGSRLFVYPMGTNDFNWTTASQIADQDIDQQGRGELKFTARSTAHLPLEFLACQPAPYNFIAYVKHAVVLAAPMAKTTPLIGGVSIGVHTPDGGPITDPGLYVALQVRGASGPWTTVGHSTPVNGVAGMFFSIPRRLGGEHVKMRAVATGSSYVTETTSSRTVDLPPALRLAAPAVRSLSVGATIRGAVRLSNRAKITDRALKIDVQIFYDGGWHVVGSATVRGSIAQVRLRIPKRFRHKHVKLRLRARGDFPTQVTPSQRVLIR